MDDHHQRVAGSVGRRIENQWHPGGQPGVARGYRAVVGAIDAVRGGGGQRRERGIGCQGGADGGARASARRHVGVDDATWLRGRAWALSITLMIWYYWSTMPERRTRCIAVGRNVLADAGYPR